MTDARSDFETRIYQRLTDTSMADEGTRLPAPANLRAEPATGHIRLSWEPVYGAAGYVIERSEDDGPPIILDHGGSDVPAIPQVTFADTGLDDGRQYTYRVGAVAGAEYPVWEWSEPASARASDAAAAGTPNRMDPVVAVRVDAAQVTGQLRRVWELIG